MKLFIRRIFLLILAIFMAFGAFLAGFVWWLSDDGLDDTLGESMKWVFKEFFRGWVEAWKARLG